MRDVPTCLVAEDESLLRRSLVEQLARAWPELHIVAECEDGASAVEALAEFEPDVAFLDIRMPGLTGLEVATAAAEASPRTRVVFVTAYDQYAIDALERIGTLPRADAPPPMTWLTASAGKETRLVLVDEVCDFRADNKYTTVVTAEGEALLRTPIKDLLAVLDPATFKQIHRSTIVNLKAIAGIVRDDSGRGTVRLKQRPETLPVSAPFMALFRHM